MIEKIIIESDYYSAEYNEGNMSQIIHERKLFGFYNTNYKVSWSVNDKIYSLSEEKVKHHVLPKWDGIAFIKSYKQIELFNTDRSLRFAIPVPTNMIQIDDYIKYRYRKLDVNSYLANNIEVLFNDIEEFKCEVERFDGFFYYQGKQYLSVKILQVNDNGRNGLYGFSQMRYLNPETGEFLPFTKSISFFEPNHHGYNEFVINL
ncbi:MAG: hypothetical protein ACPGSD_03980 [Flavobacteriales bacterium]